MSDYHFLSCVNQNYLVYLFVMYQTILNSLEETEHDAQDHFVFHVILDKDIAQQKAQACVQAFSKLNAASKVSFSFNFYTVDSSVFNSCTLMSRDGVASLAPYHRILFARVLPAHVSRILYLDVDLLVCADIRQIFLQNPQQEEILYATPCIGYSIVAQDPEAQEPVCLLPSRIAGQEPYSLPVRYGIESGVLLINVDQWRKQNFEQKCLDIAAKWQLRYHDQDILSIALQGQASYMSIEWNFHAMYCRVDQIRNENNPSTIRKLDRLPFNLPNKEQLHAMCANPKIMHFIGDFKPWRVTSGFNRLYQLTYEFWSPYSAKWLKQYVRILQHFKAEKCL